MLFSHGTMIIDDLLTNIDEKKNPCVVGLDPDIERMPTGFHKGTTHNDVARTFTRFNKHIIDAVADIVPAVKPQIAFYEKYGAPGLEAFKDTVDYARSKGLVVIGDAKRNDVGNTSKAYAQGHLGTVMTSDRDNAITKPSLDLDFVTVNPYLGRDGITPFVDVCKEHEKGIFVLVKTSNKSSGELQDRRVEITDSERRDLQRSGVQADDGRNNLYTVVAAQVNQYAQEMIGERGYAPIGAVVGATYPRQASELRNIMRNSFFLVPGYGAQEGSADDLTNCFNEDGYGAIINSSRGIIYAYQHQDDPGRFAEHARTAAQTMVSDINSALDKAGKLPGHWD